MIETYRIMNKQTKEWWEGKAPSAEAACIFTGWPSKVCWVRKHSLKGAGGWKNPDTIKKGE